MNPKRRRSGDRAILWFLLVSLLVHHALVISVVRVPDLTLYKPVEVEFFPSGDVAHDVEKPPWPEVPGVEPGERVPLPDQEQKRLAEKESVEKDKPSEEKEPEPKKEEPKPEDEAEPPDELIALVPVDGLHFVDVRDHESDEPPPDAQFFAPINSVVDEETRAENTNLDGDQGQSSPDSSGEPDEVTGNALESLAAHLVEEDKQPVEDSPVTEMPEKPDYLESTPQPSPALQDKSDGSVAKKSLDSEPVVLPSLTPESSPPVKIAVSEDGEILDLDGGEVIPSFKESKKAKEKAGGDKPGPDARLAEMDMTWTEMEGVFGAQMEEMKKSWKEAKKAKKKGGFTGDIDKVFSQLENFNPDVKPGNQTALNAAYHPFAEYITAFHRNLHPHWGDGFLASLITRPNGDPLHDMSLLVKLEFVILPDGTIEKVTVVKSSGNLVYDVAAIDALYAGQPYPPPPDIIASFNGKVYMRWGMYRNHSQCGVWNAEPYIIAAPDSKKKLKPPKEKQPPPSSE